MGSPKTKSILNSDKFQPYKGGGIFKGENPRKLDTGKMLNNLKHTMNLYGQSAGHIQSEQAQHLSDEIKSDTDEY